MLESRRDKESERAADKEVRREEGEEGETDERRSCMEWGKELTLLSQTYYQNIGSYSFP